MRVLLHTNVPVVEKHAACNIHPVSAEHSQRNRKMLVIFPNRNHGEPKSRTDDVRGPHFPWRLSGCCRSRFSQIMRTRLLARRISKWQSGTFLGVCRGNYNVNRTSVMDRSVCNSRASARLDGGLTARPSPWATQSQGRCTDLRLFPGLGTHSYAASTVLNYIFLVTLVVTGSGGGRGFFLLVLQWVWIIQWWCWRMSAFCGFTSSFQIVGVCHLFPLFHFLLSLSLVQTIQGKQTICKHHPRYNIHLIKTSYFLHSGQIKVKVKCPTFSSPMTPGNPRTRQENMLQKEHRC